MKKALLIFTLAAMPLAAQSWEVGAFVGQQSYNDINFMGVQAKPDSKVMAAVRGGYSFVDFGPVLFQFNAGFQPKASATVKVNGVDAGEKLDHQATNVGLAFIFKAGVSASVGVDYRWDKLEVPGTSTTYGRPWARANIGFAFPTPLVKPFVSLELAAPLASKKIEDAHSSEDALKVLAPKMQIGLYAGIRF
jgi:hypothetical protein